MNEQYDNERRLIGGAIDQAAAELELKEVKASADWYQARNKELEARLTDAKNWLIDTREGWAGSAADFEEYYSGLAELLGVDLNTTVQVQFTISVSATVSLPIGHEVSEYDFDLNGVDLDVNESNWEIEIDDYSINEVEQL